MDTDLDVMQVCFNGHIVTERLLADPESGRCHCERCGAATLTHCLTCGELILGVGRAPDLVTIGAVAPPRHCEACGAAFPWIPRARPVSEPLAQLESLLRRMPIVIRQLRSRHGDRPSFRVEDERDLEDLVRALLPLHFDDIRPESRTPRYSAGTRTDFLLPAAEIALAVKFLRPGNSRQLADEWREDAEYYQERGGDWLIVGFVYDPEGLLSDQQALDNLAARIAVDGKFRCIAAG